VHGRDEEWERERGAREGSERAKGRRGRGERARGARDRWGESGGARGAKGTREERARKGERGAKGGKGGARSEGREGERISDRRPKPTFYIRVIKPTFQTMVVILAEWFLGGSDPCFGDSGREGNIIQNLKV
jgi:hypothetical protein